MQYQDVSASEGTLPLPLIGHGFTLTLLLGSE